MKIGPGKYFGEVALVRETPRTATVTTLTRCVILSISKAKFAIFFKEAPEAVSDFEVKLARYDVTMRSVLYHPVGVDFFRKHLEAEYSTENIDFWQACRDYRHFDPSQFTTDEEKDEKRLALATSIVNQFVKEGANNQVNINAIVREKITKNILKDKKAEQNSFSEAESHIISLMALDSFNRFKQSPLFQQFLDKADAYSTSQNLHDKVDVMPNTARVRSASNKDMDERKSIFNLDEMKQAKS